MAATAGASADCSQALPLVEGIRAECLLADKVYDTNEIVAAAVALGMEPVIPPKSNRREKRDYDRALYKLRHLVENGFLEFKQWRGWPPGMPSGQLPSWPSANCGLCRSGASCFDDTPWDTMSSSLTRALSSSPVSSRARRPSPGRQPGSPRWPERYRALLATGRPAGPGSGALADDGGVSRARWLPGSGTSIRQPRPQKLGWYACRHRARLSSL